MHSLSASSRAPPLPLTGHRCRAAARAPMPPTPAAAARGPSGGGAGGAFDTARYDAERLKLDAQARNSMIRKVARAAAGCVCSSRRSGGARCTRSTLARC